MKRRQFITLLSGGCLAWPLAARAQRRDHMRRVGVLIGLPESDAEAVRRLNTLKQALDELGWREGQNVRIYHRGAGDVVGMQTCAAELVGLKPDVILAHATPATAAVRRASSNIPIVFVSVADPIGSGFVESFSRPGGNSTGAAASASSPTASAHRASSSSCSTSPD